MEDSNIIQLVRQLTREYRFDFHEVAANLNEQTARNFTPEECRIMFANDYVPPVETLLSASSIVEEEEVPLTFDQVLQQQRIRQEQNAKRHEELFQRVLSSLETPDVITTPLPADILAARQHRLEMQRQQELHEQRLQERDEMRALQQEREILRRRYDSGSKDAEGIDIPLSPPQAESKEDTHPVLLQFSIDTLLNNPHFEQLLSDIERDLNITPAVNLAESKDGEVEESTSELGEILEYLAKAAKSAPPKTVVPSTATLLPPAPPVVGATAKPAPSTTVRASSLASSNKPEPPQEKNIQAETASKPSPIMPQHRSAPPQAAPSRGRYVMHDSDESGSDDDNWRRARNKFKSAAPAAMDVPVTGIWGAAGQKEPTIVAAPATTLAETIEALSDSEEESEDEEEEEENMVELNRSGVLEDKSDESDEEKSLPVYSDSDPEVVVADAPSEPSSPLEKIDAERLKVSPIKSPVALPAVSCYTAEPTYALPVEQPKGLLESGRSRGQGRAASKFNTSITKAQQRREGRKNEPHQATAPSPPPVATRLDEESTSDTLTAPVYSTSASTMYDVPKPISPDQPIDIVTPPTMNMSAKETTQTFKYDTVDTPYTPNVSSSFRNALSAVQDSFAPVPHALAGIVTLQVKLNCCHSIEPDVAALPYDILLSIILPYILRLVRIINCQIVTIVMQQPEVNEDNDGSPCLYVALKGKPSLRDVLHEKLNNNLEHTFKSLNLPVSITQQLHPYERLRLTSIISILSERLGMESLSLMCSPPSQTIIPDADTCVVEFKAYLLSHATTLTNIFCELLVQGYRIIGTRTAFLGDGAGCKLHESCDIIAENEYAVLAVALQCPHAESPLVKLRDIIGPEDPELARATSPSSFRALYGEDSKRNLCHPLRIHPRTRTIEILTWFGARCGGANYGALVLPQRMYVQTCVEFLCSICASEQINLEYVIQHEHSELQRHVLDMLINVMTTLNLQNVRVQPSDGLGYTLVAAYVTDASPTHINTIISNLQASQLWSKHNFWNISLDCQSSAGILNEDNRNDDSAAISSSTIPTHFFESHADCDMYDSLLVTCPEVLNFPCTSFVFLWKVLLTLPNDCSAYLSGCKTIHSSAGARLYAVFRGKHIIESIHDAAERAILNCCASNTINSISPSQLLQHHDIRFMSGRKAYEAICRHGISADLSLPILHYNAHVPSYAQVEPVLPLFSPGIIEQLTVILIPYDNALTGQFFRILKKIEKENFNVLHITHTLVTPAVASALLEEYRLYYGDSMDITRAVLCAAGVQHAVLLVQGSSAVQRVRTFLGPPDAALATARYPNSIAAMRPAGEVSVPICPLGVASAARIIQSIYKISHNRIVTRATMQDLCNDNILDLSTLCTLPPIISVDDRAKIVESEQNATYTTYSWDGLPESPLQNMSDDLMHIPEGMDVSCIVVTATLLREVGGAAIIGALNKENLSVVCMKTVSLSKNAVKNVLLLAGASSLSIKPPLSLMTTSPVLVIAVEGSSYSVMRLRSLLQVDHAGMQFGGLASLQNSALARCKSGEWGVVLSSSARLAHQLSCYCCTELFGAVKICSTNVTGENKEDMVYHTPPQSPSRKEPNSAGSEKYFTPSTSTKKAQDMSKEGLGDVAVSLDKQF